MDFSSIIRLRNGVENGRLSGTFICSLFLLTTLNVPSVFAQSFFSTIVVEPVVGVDRGSTLNIQKLDIPTAFLTFGTYGSEDIGQLVGGLGYAYPDLLIAGDQLDFAGVVAGPSDDGGHELLAGGVGYRVPIGDGQTYLFGGADFGNIRLGTSENLALGTLGNRASWVVGLRRSIELDQNTDLTTSFEMVRRSATGEILGTTVIDEDLRFVRLAVLYNKGAPFSFQRRFSAAVSKGFDAFGASPPINPYSSLPGASSDFLRLSFSAEASIPLPRRLVANLGLIGQWSNDSLPLPQRCGYGTNSYSRGFDRSYVNGDQCLGTRTELAYNFELPNPRDERTKFTQGYVGVDFGWVEENPNAVIPRTTETWSSGSLGVRTLRGDFIGEISLTRIFDQPASVVPQDRNRLWARGAIKF